MAQAAVAGDDKADLNDPWLRSFFITRLQMLDADRSGYWGTWRDIASQFAPRRGRFVQSTNDYTRGRRKDTRIIDNTGLLASRIMASGMMAGISSPARPWFRLRFADDEANKREDVRAWCEEVQRRMLDVIARSNVYNCLHTVYAEIGNFGTAALWIDEDFEDIVRGYALTAGEYWLASSNRLSVDTIYRSVFWTVRQIVERFGRERVSATIRSMYDNGVSLDREYEIIHAIEPNPQAAAPTQRPVEQGGYPWGGHLATRFPWRSVWFERGQQSENMLLKISGYEDFPCMCPRWEIAGTDTYGSGGAPGWVALGDAQQLQQQQRRKLEVIDKLSKPPMVGPPELDNKPASLLPGGLTLVATGGAEFKPAFQVHPESINALREDIATTQDRIKQAFYADLFLMMAESDRREITAREIDERHEEKMLMLGPVLERLHDELLDPLVKRVFNVMARRGMIPPPPEGLPIATMGVEFISMLAAAQKAASTSTIERVWQFAAAIGQLKPEVLDRLDPDGTIDSYVDMVGVPASITVDKEQAQQIRAQRAKQQQQDAALARMEVLAKAGKDAAAIDVGGGQNAVQAMVGSNP